MYIKHETQSTMVTCTSTMPEADKVIKIQVKNVLFYGTVQ